MKSLHNKLNPMTKMTEEILIAGFGGQGVLSMGKIMAYSGVMQDMEVSWMPSYGPEMRGGTANVIVILSSERISSPIIRHFDTAIILNQQSLDKFESSVKPGGILIYDGNGITRHPERKDIAIYRVDATEEASRMNSSKTFNMIVLGGFLKVKPVLSIENVVKGLKKSLPERYHKLIPENEIALKRGEEIIREVQTV
jgi:2-oxoglutarate ferredoxin oxidoreductase subunit gamma